MPNYHAPLRDMQFLLEEVFNLPEILKFPAFSHVDKDITLPILEEAAKICEQEIAPLNQSGDKEGCQFNEGEVKTPKGFKKAYQHFVTGGWMSLNTNPKHGGQGLPKMLQVCIDEMLTSANVSFSLYTVLTQGAAHALALYGIKELQDLYLPKLASGEWGGTMCLTESHCGSDLGLLRTKAEPNPDGTYTLSGTKIFITSGEHDLTDNIIHMVLARLPDAPAGIKGISMFLVPKIKVNPDGSLGKRNAVKCGSIEHKMGIKASSTCVINFDGATGYLIGDANKGMTTMFSMMNLERINIGLEGLGLGEIAYQNARAYAHDRLQSRSLTGTKFPEKPADPIIVHPDVRRMLLTMKAYNEGCRAFALWAGKLVDISRHHPEISQRQQAEDLLALLTPIIKAFFTDCGFEVCNLGLQVFGGHGYIQEWGMEQFVRDARIAQIYEGANGIQALDLVRRKLVNNNGEYVKLLTELIDNFIAEHKQDIELQFFIHSLEIKLKDLSEINAWIIRKSAENPDIMGSSSSDYLKLIALVILAFLWAQMAEIAIKKRTLADFYSSKFYTAEFYFTKLLPQVDSLKQTIMAGSDPLMKIPINQF